MKVAVVTLGTRGDVQPYVAVARALMARGHEVTLAASPEHEVLVRSHGVSYRATSVNMRELLRTDLGRAWLTSGDSPRKYARYAKELFLPLQRACCEDADAATEGADGVVFYMLALGTLHAAERRRLPSVALAPWPIVPSRELTPPFALWLERAPGIVRRWASDVFPRLAFAPMNAEHLAHRARVGLPRYAAPDPYHAILEAGTPTIGLFSEAVIPRPADWEARHTVAGYAFTPTLAYEPSPALLDFLTAGAPPIYLGFGSMTGFEPEELAALAIGAARRAGVRAVIATGWADLPVGMAEDVYVVDEVPHDWLFPRVAAVVHHGGAGTFAEGLRAGKPTAIAAFFGDQPFWGRMNERLGTGPRALLRTRLTAETLSEVIRTAIAGPYAARAATLGERIRAEDGAAAAAAMAERALSPR